MNDQFYLQDSRNHAYVGDGLSFWGFGGSGYVTDLAKAQVFSREALAITATLTSHGPRPTWTPGHVLVSTASM